MQENFGSYLRSVRERNERSLDFVATRSGYAKGYISEIETGRKMPGFFALECIIDAIPAADEKERLISMLVNARMGKAC